MSQLGPNTHGTVGGNVSDSSVLAATIVGQYVSNNQIPMDQVPVLVTNIISALNGHGTVNQAKVQGTEHPAAVAELVDSEPLKPAVPIRKSITDDYIICLEDGKKFKSLKRHLASEFNMTPEQYRTKWGLKADYPMVAPNYSAARSAMAKSMGLGQKAATGDADTAPQAAPAAPEPKPARRVRTEGQAEAAAA